MKISELRINNLVHYPRSEGNDLCEIWSINFEQTVEIFCDGNNEGESSYSVTVDSFAISGIPLTEEWLLKFGFEYRNESRGLGAIFDLKKHPENTQVAEWKFHKSVAFVCDKNNKNDIYLHNLQHPTAYKMKYVHQLQNLYFALTGEELEQNVENSDCTDEEKEVN